MKAIVIDAFGGADKLHPAELPSPNPAAGEVLVEIAATSVNPVDWKIREGKLARMFPHHFPLIPGWDAAGTVAAVGSAVKGFHKGEKVYAYCRKPEVQWGTYAELVTVPETSVAPMPATLAFEAAAAIPLVGLTALQCLELAGVKAGQTVLVQGGAGGVGSMGIQLARVAGARVLTTASAKNHEYVRSLGAELAIDYTQEDVAKAVRRHVPDGVDVVLDFVGGEAQKQAYGMTRRGGKVVSIVGMPDRALADQHGVEGGYVFVAPSGQQLRHLARLIDEGQLKPPAVQVMPLQDAARAQDLSRAGHTRGKIVLKVK
ncbi:MAG: NADP-dependent oxidoreductase [Myxococcota bacterium]